MGRLVRAGLVCGAVLVCAAPARAEKTAVLVESSSDAGTLASDLETLLRKEGHEIGADRNAGMRVSFALLHR